MLFLFRCVRWLPVVFVTALVAWSYYAFVVVICATVVDDVAIKVVYSIAYHVIFFLFMLSYWVTIMTNPAEPSEKYKLSEQDEDDLKHGISVEDVLRRLVVNRDLKVYTRNDEGVFRFCDKTRVLKPDRCKYCSVSRQCVLKMDHFCPWVNNTVGFSNYKSFLLFLFYTQIYTLFVALTVLPYFIMFWTEKEHKHSDSDRMQTLFLFFVALLFSVGVLSLFGMHIYLVLNNKTTLEASRPTMFYYGQDKNGFGLGWKENLRQVFGPSIKKWLLPFNNSIGNGCEFPLRRVDCESQQLLTIRAAHIEDGDSSDAGIH
ncbi:palmitoyltransferase ZDHHC2-like isoform X2 [Corticium candelabrum]|uniref:palmitoyltransferase ZDHHC2-like isoform X2 n=1 Tax=Corticium candelabrum TaxID=121492 RepID=UPI002E260DCA|nr:palmitoyltransferase ZDHHC2-like isoform X2 [Corticium candelabrum]